VGHGIEKQAGVNGSVVLTFRGTQEEKDIIARKIRRLSKVLRLDERPCESQNLRKSAIILVNRELVPVDLACKESVLTCELVNTEPLMWTYFLAGTPNELDMLLERLETAGVIKDIVYSVMSL
jgi:hypothetical protein